MKNHGSKSSHENIRHNIVMSCVPRSFSLLQKDFQIKKSANVLICPDKLSPNGENVFLTNAWPDFRKGHGGEDPALFPPEIIVAVKALACQLPKQLGLPFSKFTHDEIAREVEKRGIVASISGKTVWRWLNKDAIRPWCYRSWIWPRDPEFEQKLQKFWTCIKVFGMKNRLIPMILFFLLMKKPVFRPATDWYPQPLRQLDAMVV